MSTLPTDIQAVHKLGTTYNLNSAAASVTIMTPGADKRFIVIEYRVHAAAAGTIKFQSGSTDIGSHEFAAAGDAPVSGSNGFGSLFGRAAGEALKVDNAGTVTLTGYFTVVEGDVRA